jgi:hypothetical protein
MTVSLGILAAAVVLCSCATMIDGPRQHMTFDSTPPGAVVHVDGYTDVTTPSSLDLARQKTHRVTIHKDGYRDATLVLDRQFNGMALGNVLLFPIGILGLAIDANSGAMSQLTPAAVSVTLEPGAGEPLAVTPPTDTENTERNTEARTIRPAGYSERYKSMAEKARNTEDNVTPTATKDSE